MTETISIERGQQLFNRRVLAMGRPEPGEDDLVELRDKLKFNLIFRSNSNELFQRYDTEKLIRGYLSDLRESSDNVREIIDILPSMKPKLDFEARLTTIRRIAGQLSSCRLVTGMNLPISWTDGKLYYLSPCEDGTMIVTSADMRGSVYGSPLMYHVGDGEIIAWRTEDCLIDYLTTLYGPTVAVKPTVSRDTCRVTKLEFHGDIDVLPEDLDWLDPDVLLVENDQLYLGDLEQLIKILIDEDDDDYEDELPDPEDIFDDVEEEHVELPSYKDIFGEDYDDGEDWDEEDEPDGESSFTIDSFLERDRLIEYPYVGFDAYLRFLELAATDKRVKRLSVCLYRIGDNPILFYVLREAVRRGKEVVVNMEPAANGEETINTFWIREMTRAGIEVIDNGEGFRKFHAKLTSVVLEDGRMIAQIGTGNYHWRTATQYNDLSLITSDPTTCTVVEDVFQLALFGRVPASELENIIFTDPAGIGIRKLLRLIRKQAELGPDGFIAIKANCLDGKTMIAEELERASIAGCRVELIIRGSCTWVPSMLNRTVRVRSVVGEQLEHSRVYQFGTGDDMEIYLGSLDPVERKLQFRSEAMVRAIRPETVAELKRYLDEYLFDRVGNVWQMVQLENGKVDYELKEVN